jgi:hypothetical protein
MSETTTGLGYDATKTFSSQANPADTQELGGGGATQLEWKNPTWGNELFPSTQIDLRKPSAQQTAYGIDKYGDPIVSTVQVERTGPVTGLEI